MPLAGGVADPLAVVLIAQRIVTRLTPNMHVFASATQLTRAQAELVLLAAGLADPLVARLVLLSETSVPLRVG